MKLAGNRVYAFLEQTLDRYLGPDDISTGSARDQTPARNQGQYIHPHADSAWIKEHFPKEWQTYYKFTIVRNPWDTLVSFYFFHKIIEPHKPIYSQDFAFFLTNTKLSGWNDWPRYTENNQVVMDRVFKFENLHAELSSDRCLPYCGELRNTFVKAQFRPKHLAYQNFYDVYTRDLVDKEFSCMINNFQYQFS